MQNHSSTPKTCFTLGLEWLCHIFSPYNSFKVARGFRIELYYTVNVLYSECIIQRIYYTAAAPWMAPFKIEELIIHKKFSMKGRDSKVVQNSNINIQIWKSSSGQNDWEEWLWHCPTPPWLSNHGRGNWDYCSWGFQIPLPPFPRVINLTWTLWCLSAYLKT